MTSKHSSRYVIGIDLGTTNCVLSYLDTFEEHPQPRTLPVKQWESIGTLVEDQTLPSFCYLPTKNEIKKAEFHALFTGAETPSDLVVGRMARNQASFTPGRVIHSAKSWLCHGGVDRAERILPWHSDEIIGEDRRSPIEASAAYLTHLKNMWTERFSDTASFVEQDIVITVPASFDEVAQRLTLDAARLAGYPMDKLQLLEEPQAAFYHWLSTHATRGGFRAALLSQLPALRERAQTVLICDIGGGTSDFSLFEIAKVSDETMYPVIKRIAVSDHLLLGGDNIDLGIAHVLEAKLTGGGARLGSQHWAHLVFEARRLKERALSSAAGVDGELFVSIAGEGSSLFANTLTVGITAEEIRTLVLDGYLPLCQADAKTKKRGGALQEWGLPYAHDSAMTRHLAEFLNGRTVDAVLYTGGTLKPDFMRERLSAVLDGWQDVRGASVTLENPDMDLATASGATYYGFVRRSPERRIKGGYARSLYVEVQRPGDTPALVCLIPKGYDSHEPLTIDRHVFKALVGEPVKFQLFSSNTRDQDRAGDVLTLDVGSLKPLPALNTRLERKVVGKVAAKPEMLDVSLRARIQETGILELACVHKSAQEEHDWALSFDVRHAESAAEMAAQVSPKINVAQLDQARALIAELYGKKKPSDDAQRRNPKSLMKDLETLLGPRDNWDTALLRQLWEDVKDGMTRRGRSRGHESSWLYLAGFTLRPGYGAPMDEWRVADLWRVFDMGLVHAKERQIEEQWWLMWRRAAGGLSAEQQERIFDKIFPALRNATTQSKEMHLLAGSLERVEMKKKIRLGNALAQQIASGKKDLLDGKIWALARLASRVPLYGGPQHVIRQKFVAEWLRQLLPLKATDKFYYSLNTLFAQAGRLVEDREFDLAPDLRSELIAKMRKEGALAEQITPLEVYKPMDIQDRTRLFGEALPPGLILG